MCKGTYACVYYDAYIYFFNCSSFILLALRKIKIVTFLEQQVTSLPKLR